jgi:hypothetical protein
MTQILELYNDKVAKVVLENAPKYAKYNSHTIQKEILQVIASKVREKFMKILGTLNSTLLLMRYEMNLRERKWLLF